MYRGFQTWCVIGNNHPTRLCPSPLTIQPWSILAAGGCSGGSRSLTGAGLASHCPVRCMLRYHLLICKDPQARPWPAVRSQVWGMRQLLPSLLHPVAHRLESSLLLPR